MLSYPALILDWRVNFAMTVAVLHLLAQVLTVFEGGSAAAVCMILLCAVAKTAWVPETLWFLPKSHKFHGLWSVRKNEDSGQPGAQTFQTETVILWVGLTGKQKTSSSVDLLFLMVDIGMPWETWRKAENRGESDYNRPYVKP